MKKIIALLLTILISAFCLAGCMEKSIDPIVGKWETNIPHTALMGVSENSTEGLYQYVNYDNVYKTFTYEFSADGYYTETTDIESYISAYKTAIEEALYKYYEAMILESGLTITVEEALEKDGVTVDSFIDQSSLEALRSEDTVREGKYKAEDGKLYLSSGREYEVDEAVYSEYTLSTDKLTLINQVGIGSDETTLSVFPLEFTRIY